MLIVQIERNDLARHTSRFACERRPPQSAALTLEAANQYGKRGYLAGVFVPYNLRRAVRGLELWFSVFASGGWAYACRSSVLM
jgi:hypothetical protein